MVSISIRALTGTYDPLMIFDFHAGDISKKIYWAIWFVLVFVVLLNGLIAFMTQQFDLIFSKQFQRRQINLDRVKLLAELPDLPKNIDATNDSENVSLNGNGKFSLISLFYIETLVCSLVTNEKHEVNYRTGRSETLFLQRDPG